MDSTQLLADVWPIAAFFLILVTMLGGMLMLSHFLGGRRQHVRRHIPYESGVVSVDNNKTRFGSHFFLYAIFFVIFDLEVIFLFAWVIAFKEVGWPGFFEASIFIFILLAALWYLWRVGALQLTRRHAHQMQTQDSFNTVNKQEAN